MANQQQQQQPVFCKFCHKVELAFNEHFKSKSGKYIPIEKAGGVPHNCSQNPNQQQKQHEDKLRENRNSTTSSTPESQQRTQPTELQLKLIHARLTHIIQLIEDLTKLVHASTQSQQQQDNYSNDRNLLDNR